MTHCYILTAERRRAQTHSQHVTNDIVHPIRILTVRVDFALGFGNVSLVDKVLFVWDRQGDRGYRWLCIVA